MDFDRRTLLASGAGLLLAPRLRAQTPLAGFTHGVASGEPGPRSMLFWTRFVASDGRPAPLKLEIATDPRMTRARVMAEVHADPARDWTARASVERLEPGRTYYYRWLGPNKERSITGRTRTLPETNPANFRVAVFSCSNLPFGWFNAYAHSVAADDADLAIHLGDYIYEYPRGTYPAAAEAVAGRLIEPAGETILLDDYRARYRSYRLDPDLQALHARMPVIALLDDHDIANDAWSGGAANHDLRTEGRWEDRVGAARSAWRDWMPVSDAPWGRYDIGRLATIYRLDARLSGRDRQLDVAGLMTGGSDATAALIRLREDQWVAGNRQLLGAAQEKWLFREMHAARSLGTRWHLLAQQVVMGELKAPANMAALGGTASSNQAMSWLNQAATSARLGLPLNLDAWDGYPAARARLLATAQRNGIDLLVLSGDSHNAWANDLQVDGRPAGVEFAVQSVTSPGFEHVLRSTAPSTFEQAMIAANPTLKWADTSRRGYLHLSLTPTEAVGEWRFTAPVAQRSDRLAAVVRARAIAMQRRLTMG